MTRITAAELPFHMESTPSFFIKEERSRCRGHSSFVTDISISKNDQMLMSNDGAGEILFWEVKTGKRIARTAKYKNLHL